MFGIILNYFGENYKTIETGIWEWLFLLNVEEIEKLILRIIPKVIWQSFPLPNQGTFTNNLFSLL